MPRPPIFESPALVVAPNLTVTGKEYLALTWRDGVQLGELSPHEAAELAAALMAWVAGLIP